jgi:hypothetical protein
VDLKEQKMEIKIPIAIVEVMKLMEVIREMQLMEMKRRSNKNLNPKLRKRRC